MVEKSNGILGQSLKGRVNEVWHPKDEIGSLHQWKHSERRPRHFRVEEGLGSGVSDCVGCGI
jgi:hypothetical protein